MARRWKVTKRVCRRCGKAFIPKAKNQQYCATCRPLHLMEYNLDYGRKYAARRKIERLGLEEDLNG